MGSWTSLGNHEEADVLLLLTDGSVMAWAVGGTTWRRLKPDAHGHYDTGTWSMPKPLPGGALHGAAVLASGKVYKFDHQQPKIYDPVNDSWSNTALPPVSQFPMTPSLQVMADGRVFHVTSGGPTLVVIYDSEADSWQTLQSEWVIESPQLLLPDDRILSFIDDDSAYPIFDPQTGVVSVIPIVPFEPNIQLFAPVLLLADGRALVQEEGQQQLLFYELGANASQSVVTPGPQFPAFDSHGWALSKAALSACLLPNGNVLCAAEYSSPVSNGTQLGEALVFYELDLSNGGATLVAQENTPFRRITAAAAAHFNAPRLVTLLMLPTGQVLVSTRVAPGAGGTVWLYTPAQTAPQAAWRPALDVCPIALVQGSTLSLSGRQVNGLSQAVSNCGGDGTVSRFGTQNATNYPLLELTDDATQTVRYLRTSNFSSMGVATGPQLSVSFDCEVGDAPVGSCKIRIVTNGIASDFCETTVYLARRPINGLAIDPMALILSEAAYLIWVEIHHPHENITVRLDEVVAVMTPAERSAALSRARTMSDYGRAITMAITALKASEGR